jgi:hypothetical protein
MLVSYENKGIDLNNKKRTIGCTFSIVSVNCVLDSIA